jgi:ubiquinone/menaquinone biosynthesis C-methylase UbiE
MEVGAGTGRFTIPAIEAGHVIVATDVNNSMIARLREKVRAAGFEGRCRIALEDIFRLSFPDEAFDLVFSLHVVPRFLELEDQRAAIREMARTLRPGGQLLFNYRNRRSLYGLFEGGHAATPAQIRQILRETGLRIVKQRGKWLLTRRLLDLLPLRAGRLVSAVDRRLAGFWPSGAWDVFVLAKKGSRPLS